MKLLLLVLAALAAISNAYGQNRPSVYVDTLANLDARKPIANETIYVRGASTVGDWGNVVLPYVYNATATNAIDRFTRAPVSGVGRYIYNWNGDVTLFGADRTGVNDSTTAILAASAMAQATKIYGNPVIYFPGGIYRLSQTLTITNQRVKIHGDTANPSAFNNSKILFTGTNLPILSVTGTKLEVRDLALEYEYMQGPLATNSVGLLLGSVVASNFENLSIRKAAYGIRDTPTLFHFQNSWRNIYLYSFSRGGIRFDKQNTVSSFDNIYVQNALDGLETSQVAITSVTNNTNNVTFTLSALPTRLRTNMMVTIAGLSPSSLNGLTFITNITGLNVSTRYASDPGAITDGVGTLEVTARYCLESPVDIGYGWITMKGLDIEHCIIDDDCALALRCELNEISDVHFEQIYSASTDTNNMFSLIGGNAASTINIGSISIANLGFFPGSTNYLAWSGFQSARGDKGTPISLGQLRARDVAKAGATWYPLRKSAATYPDLLLLGGYDLEGEVRPYGDARFTDENFGMSRPVRWKEGILSGSSGAEASIMLRPRVAQTGSANWTGVHISPTNTDLAFGSGGGYPFRYTAGGFDRFYVQENGRMVMTAGSSNSTGVTTTFQGHDQVYPSGRINLIYGQTNAASRMNVGPNYVYVTDNSGANQPLYLQLLGSTVIVGSGASGSGIRVGGGGNALIQNIQSTTFAWDPGSLADGASEQVLSTGLSAVGSNDQILATLSSIGTNKFVITAVPTGNTNQVAVTLLNASGTTVDIPSGTLRITVIDF